MELQYIGQKSMYCFFVLVSFVYVRELDVLSIFPQKK